MSRTESSSCSARCSRGLREPRRIAARRLPVRADRRAARSRGDRACRDRLVLRRIDYHPESTIVATIGLLYILQQAVLTLYGRMRGRCPRRCPSPCSSRGSDIPATSWSWRRSRRCCLRRPGAARAHAPRVVHARRAAGPGDGAGVRRFRRAASTRSCSRWARCLPPRRACSSCRSSRRITDGLDPLLFRSSS